MTDTLVQIIFGWPPIISSILLSIVGLWLKKPGLLAVPIVIVAALLAYAVVLQ